MKIAIIGAGPAGLIAARNAITEGFEVVLFEKLARVGGIWNPDSGGAYRNARMQNSRWTFHFSSVASEDCDDFPCVAQVGDYLARMAACDGIMNVARLNTTVTGLTRKANEWLVTSQQENEHRQESFDKIIISTGELWQPRSLAVPGIAHFSGSVVTSRGYQHPEEFAGKRVLVVGGGVSGADIASDLVPVARSVTLSVKRMGLFLPRRFPAGPNDMMHSYLGRYLLNQLPYEEFLTYLDDILPEYMQVYRSSGMLPAVSNNNAIHVNEKIIPNIASGRIVVKPPLERFHENGLAEFVDASRADYDAIISCAGYEMPDYSFVPKFNRTRLYEHFFWVDDPTLCVINPPVDTAGFGAAFPYFDVISKWVMGIFAGRIQLPPAEIMEKWCADHMHSLHIKRFYDSWLETIRIGVHCGVLPSPEKNFRRYWNLVTSVAKPEYLVSAPLIPNPGLMDALLHIKEAKVKLLAGLPETILSQFLAQGEITEEEYVAAMNLPADTIIHAGLPYSQVYL